MSFCTDQCLLLPQLMLKPLLYGYKNKHSGDSYSLTPMPLLHQWLYSTSTGTFFPTGNCSIQGLLMGKITDASFPPSSQMKPSVKATTQRGSSWLSSSLIFFCVVMSTSICSHHLVPVENCLVRIRLSPRGSYI